MESAFEDDRFKHIATDPRFRRIPKNVKKVKVDKRFKDMFVNKKFKDSEKLDERGRSLKLTSTENLKNLYNVTDSSEESDKEDVSAATDSKNTWKEKMNVKDKNHKNLQSKNLKSVNLKIEKIKPKTNLKSETNLDSDSSENEDKLNAVNTNNVGKILETFDDNNLKDRDSSDKSSSVNESSDSEETDSSSDSEVEENETSELDHHWEELQADAPDADEIFRRLAVCNMDWDRIRAEDLYSVFNSFKPPDSCLISVKIYPSEYGLKRMEEEKLKGPAELVEKELDPSEEAKDSEDKKTSKYHREKLRQYQLNRLKYFYAVVECDTPETANALYEQLNGMEYESSSIRFDLRFIPDDITFDQEPTSVVDKAPDPGVYKPRLFVTSALQQVKVNLTWDETDPKRRETLQKAFSEPSAIEKDIREYLASSSGGSESEDESREKDSKDLSTKERIAKYKALVQSLEENEKKKEDECEMEISWNPDLKEKTEKLVKEKSEVPCNPFEEKLKKMKEKKLKKKMKKMTSETDSDSQKSDTEEIKPSRNEKESSREINELYLFADSDAPIKSEVRGKKKKKGIAHVEDFKCNVNDPRFSAVYTSHEFNVDPSDPHFKATEGSLAIVREKQKRLRAEEEGKRKRSKHL